MKTSPRPNCGRPDMNTVYVDGRDRQFGVLRPKARPFIPLSGAKISCRK